MPADSKDPSNVTQVTRNESLDPKIGWASKVTDNHCHKSPRYTHVGQRRLCRAYTEEREAAEIGEALFPQVTEAKAAETAVVITNATHHGHYRVNADVPSGQARGTETTVKMCDLRNPTDAAKTILVTWSTHDAYFPVRSLNAGSAQKCKTVQPEHWLN